MVSLSAQPKSRRHYWRRYCWRWKVLGNSVAVKTIDFKIVNKSEHDEFLSGVTDVKNIEKFADRKRRIGTKNDWFVIDFDLAVKNSKKYSNV